MNQHDQHVLVLREHVTPASVRAIAQAAQWDLRSDIVRSHFVAGSLGWRVGPGTTVDYVEDPTAEVRYVRTSGPQAGPAAAQLRAALAHYDEDELFSDLAATDDAVTWIRGLGRLAVLRTPQSSSRFQGLWEQALQHPHIAVRRAAVRTIYGQPWPELASGVRRRLDADVALAGPLEKLVRYLEREPNLDSGPD